MKMLSLLLLLFFTTVFGSISASAQTWEKYCNSPEGGYILKTASDGDSVLALMTYSKIYVKKVQDPNWTFVANICLGDNKPCWFVGGGYVLAADAIGFVRYSFATKSIDRFPFPDGVRSEDVKFISANGNKCAVWGYSSIEQKRFVYDFATSAWIVNEIVDYSITDMAADANGNVWRTSYAEFGYEHTKSEDLGDSWTSTFTNNASKLIVEKSGALFCFESGKITKVNEVGEELATYWGIDNNMPKEILVYNDEKLIMRFTSKLLIADIKSQASIDTISISTIDEGYYTSSACIGTNLYVSTFENLYKFSSLQSEPTKENAGINSAMGLFIVPYKNKLLMRSLFGLYGIDQFGSVKLSNAYSDIYEPNGRDMFVASNNSIYIFDKKNQTIKFSTDDGQNWTDVVIPSGDVPQYVTELPQIGIVIAVGDNNRIYSAPLASANATLLASFNSLSAQYFHFIKNFGATIFAFTTQYVFRSTDAGLHWEFIPCDNMFSSISDVFDMGNNTLWLTSSSRILESTDMGANWSIVTDNFHYQYPMQLPDKSLLIADALTTDIFRLHPDKTFEKLATQTPDAFSTSFCIIDDYIYTSTIGGDVYRMYLSILSADEKQVNPAPKAYPNPASSFVTIDLGMELSDLSIEVFNSLGEKLNIEFVQNGQLAIVGTQLLAPGVYSARVNSNGQSRIVSFVVAK